MASTTIATSELVRSKPDGYTIYFTGSAALTITPLSIPGLPFDVAKDVEPIALVAAEHLGLELDVAEAVAELGAGLGERVEVAGRRVLRRLQRRLGRRAADDECEVVRRA